ncbi:hypothetical protein RI129_003818 [Pyrocoelia pectoralis]|uniref:FXNA-like protease n=1 Tax=Pyrocoelia pectoralis TaxID=417401 RepID=A0AAN7VQ91_9COLE
MDAQEGIKKRRQSGKIPTLVGLISIILISTLCGIVYLINDILPTPLYIEDEVHNPERFIAERAQNSLIKLVAIGPRVTGTDANEIQAVKLLRLEIAEIIENAHKNQKIEFDQQVVSGKTESWNGVHIFENVQNLVVKVHAQKYSEHSLLVNVHFDSAPTSPGGSDDGINCAVALEALRKIGNSPITYSHNIIFLFNGAEEVGLLGAQGFVTQHRWSREVKFLINLDANGVGGKIMLFQAGPKQEQFLKYFSTVSLPHAQVAAEEIYEYLPSNTDFTVFTKVGRYAGFDLAFVRDRQKYHSPFDDNNIPLGCYQHVGDTLLKLLKNLANASVIAEINQIQNSNDSVYYDFLGLFLVHYTKTIAIVINVLCAILSVLIALKGFYDFRIKFSRRFLAYIVVTFLGLALGWALAAAFAITISFILKAQDYKMIWYGNSWMIWGLYVVPISAVSCVPIAVFKRFIIKDLTYNMHTQIQMHLFRVIWTVLLVVGTCMGIRSSYVVLIPVLFQTCAFMSIHFTCSQYTERVWQILYLIFSIPSVMFLIYVILLITPTATTVSGDLYINPELLVALIYLFLTLLVTSTYVPFVTLLQRSYIIIVTAMGIFLLFLILVFTPITFPYSSSNNQPSPQKFTTYYANNILRNETSNNIYGRHKNIFNIGDYNAEKTISKYIREPKFNEDNDLIPLTKAVKLQLDSKIYLSSTLMQYNFTIEGPSAMNFKIETINNATIKSAKIYMTNEDVILQSNVTQYEIRYNRGKASLPLKMVFKVYLVKHGYKALQLNLSGFYQYKLSDVSIPYYDEYLKSFPTWTNVDAKLVITDTWTF